MGQENDCSSKDFNITPKNEIEKMLYRFVKQNILWRWSEFVLFVVMEKKKKGCLNKSMIYLMDCLRQLAYIKSVSVTFLQFLAND